jgi:hypothetical protein
MSQQMSVPPPGYGQVRVQLGDIAVTDTRVHTPVGSYPLAGTTWMMTPQTYVTESIPAWAIVCAIIFFVFCLLGLLFLLVKERRLYGTVQVSVSGPGLSYSTYIPVYNELAVSQISRNVDWIRYQVTRQSA